MKDVNKVIFEALAAHRSVVLPGLGYLEVTRKQAKRLSDTQLIPPRNVVVFSTAEPAGNASVVDLVASSESISTDAARGIYDAWLTGARTGQGVAIEGVGEIQGGEFIPVEAMTAALNPANEQQIVTMEKGKSTKKGRVWGWILLVLGLAVCAFLWLNHKGYFKGCGKKKAATEVVAGAEKAGETITGEGTEAAAGEMLDAVKDDAAAIGKTAAAAAGVAAATTGTGTSTAKTTATVPSTATTTPITGSATTKLATATSAHDGRWHVIAGTFAIESNADRLIERIHRTHPDLTLTKITNPGNGYHMVSIYSTPSKREAHTKINDYWDIDLYLWVWPSK